MNKIIHALEPTFWIATVILFFHWLFSVSPQQDLVGDISGWWWFSTALIATFLSEYNSNNC